MSQDDTSISMSTYGTLEACEAEQARRAASAGQSSTPVPREGGPDEAESGLFAQFMAEAAQAGITKLDFSRLAHIAPQAAADTGAVVDLILAYGAACTVMDERAPAIMEAIKRALAAVPPAKAEGLTDQAMWDAAVSEAGTEHNRFRGECIVLNSPEEVGGVFRAILAQQAKGATK